ncbi:MAG: hypothetical protein WD397_11815 [Wenzhouxiangellaceae bacterium]
MLNHSVTPSRFAVILSLAAICLLGAVWFFVNFGEGHQTVSANSNGDAAVVDSGAETKADNVTRHSESAAANVGEVSNIRARDTNDSMSEVLSLFGLSSDSSGSLEDIYIDAEMDAPQNGDAAWKAATIRADCDFSAGAATSDEDLPDIYEVIFEQCSLVDQVAIYEKWELVEFGAVNGNFDAIVAQLSFPPPPGALQGPDGPLTTEEWTDLVVNRVRKAADRGYPDAMLKAAEIHSGLLRSETNYELAEMYLERLLQVPDLTPYQESMAFELLKVVRSSKGVRG